jgi:hypothetical protein
VSLTRGPEVRFHAQVDLQVSALEPAAAALRQVRRLGHLLNSQYVRVESAGESFAAGRHGQLHMIDARNSQFAAPLKTPMRLTQG